MAIVPQTFLFSSTCEVAKTGKISRSIAMGRSSSDDEVQMIVKLLRQLFPHFIYRHSTIAQFHCKPLSGTRAVHRRGERGPTLLIAKPLP
jgi:hypothetical protein